MALIRQARAQSFVKDAIVLNLGDLAQQAQRLRESASAQAREIIEEAHRERARILAGAKEDGIQQGLVEGRRKGKEEGRVEGHQQALKESRERLDQLEVAWAAALTEFEIQRGELIQGGASAVLNLVLDIARRVVKEHVEAHPEAVVKQVESALALSMTRGRAVVRVHPLDASLVREALPRLTSALQSGETRIEEDAAIARGSCVVRGATGTVDASIVVQLDRIAKALLGRPEGEPEEPAR
jgi:flagellar assembly protein FliH